MSHEQYRPHPNQFIKHYAGRLACLAVNTALTVKHEVFPPKPDLPKPLTDSELVILDDETAVIRSKE